MDLISEMIVELVMADTPARRGRPSGTIPTRRSRRQSPRLGAQAAALL